MAQNWDFIFSPFNLSVGAFPLSCAATTTTHRPPLRLLHISVDRPWMMNLYYSYAIGAHSISPLSSLPLLSLHRTRKKRLSHSQLFIRWNSNSIGKLGCTVVTASNNDRNNGGSDLLEECEERVEVIAVGSRKDAVLDFCSASPFVSPVLRFWYIAALVILVILCVYTIWAL